MAKLGRQGGMVGLLHGTNSRHVWSAVLAGGGLLAQVCLSLCLAAAANQPPTLTDSSSRAAAASHATPPCPRPAHPLLTASATGCSKAQLPLLDPSRL